MQAGRARQAAEVVSLSPVNPPHSFSRSCFSLALITAALVAALQVAPAQTASQQQPAVRVVSAPPAAPAQSRDLAVEASKKLDDDINNILRSARSSKLLKRNASFTDEAQVATDAAPPPLAFYRVFAVDAGGAEVPAPGGPSP